MIETRYALKLWNRCVLLPCLAMLAIASVAIAAEGGHSHVVATSQAGAQVCFPAKLWNAPNKEDRPCTTVFRPQEDGSGDLILGSVGADAATCTIPNVYEERGHFSIQCHRVRNVYGSKPGPGGSGAAPTPPSSPPTPTPPSSPPAPRTDGGEQEANAEAVAECMAEAEAEARNTGIPIEAGECEVIE